MISVVILAAEPHLGFPRPSRFYFGHRHGWAIASCVIAALLLGIGACAPKPVVRKPVLTTDQVPLVRLTSGQYPYFEDCNAYRQLGPAIDHSLAYLRRLPTERQLRFGPDTYSVGHVIRSLEVFANIIRTHPTADELNRMVGDNFIVYQASGRAGDGAVLFIGYYEPLIAASPVFSEKFPVPLHSRPRDWVEINLGLFDPELQGRTIVGRYTGGSVVPYPTREAIANRPDFEQIAPPVAWVQDEIDRFNLQLQGSGRIFFSDGREMNVQYHGANGQPYRSIGRLLIDQGKISADNISLQSIRTYLQRHPDQVTEIMNQNPRYVFFRIADHPTHGALDLPLTARRSIAVDRQQFPLGALAFLHAPMPVVTDQGTISTWSPFSAFALAQDTGSAITGAGRADVYWGCGQAAEVAAGHLKNDGQLYFLILKPNGETP